MRVSGVVLALLVLVGAVLCGSVQSDSQKWGAFIKKYGKSYASTAEETTRYGHF
ncbi:hypothetical protein KIPB_013318, partial [Kipferlia bialata]|eukprot:g13318.t1